MATKQQLKAEIDRLTDQLIAKSRAYERRVAYIRQQHEDGRHNFSGDLRTVLNQDVILSDLSGSSKTIAAVLSALTGAYLVAVDRT